VTPLAPLPDLPPQGLQSLLLRLDQDQHRCPCSRRDLIPEPGRDWWLQAHAAKRGPLQGSGEDQPVNGYREGGGAEIRDAARRCALRIAWRAAAYQQCAEIRDAARR